MSNLGLDVYQSNFDQDEYSKQIKEYRALPSPGKSYGKVFVKGSSTFGREKIALLMPPV